MRSVTQTYMLLVVAWTTIMSGSCRLAPSSAPVPIAGGREDLAGIAGEWSGRYWSGAANRHGTIVFRLRAGADTAYGEVEMTFAPSLKLYGDSQSDEDRQSHVCTVIDIAIVRVEGNMIRGTLAPHWDPDCDCRASTVFEGTLTADRIAGTFRSRRESNGAPLLAGEWLAERQ